LGHPTYDVHLLVWIINHRRIKLQTTIYKLNRRFTNYNLQTKNYNLQTKNYNLQTTIYKLKTTIYKLNRRFTNYNLQTKNYNLQTLPTMQDSLKIHNGLIRFYASYLIYISIFKQNGDSKQAERFTFCFIVSSFIWFLYRHACWWPDKEPKHVANV
jgi:exonuclease VII large subunit